MIAGIIRRETKRHYVPFQGVHCNTFRVVPKLNPNPSETPVNI